MIFKETPLPGAYLIEIERKEDHRGFFARAWCREEFERHGLDPGLVQINMAFNAKKGTLRGMHLQEPPDAEVKVVRCTSGAIFDVAVDLRPGSGTQGRWFGVELNCRNRSMLYIPEGFAHGYQVLEDETEMYYLTTKPYAPKSARGYRYNDPAFGIEWPLPVSCISDADASWPDYRF